MDQLSHAQFEDFPPGGRRTNSRAHQSSLSSGLIVTADSEPLPHHLNRPRIAHDVADMHGDTWTSMHQTHPMSREVPAFETTYAAQTSASHDPQAGGSMVQHGRRTGKKVFSQPASVGQPRLPLGVASSGGGGTLADRSLQGLQAGTTKTSSHVPGQCGFNLCLVGLWLGTLERDILGFSDFLLIPQSPLARDQVIPATSPS